MLLLFTDAMIALGFSFLCSVAEAVILSVTSPYIALMQQQGRRAGDLLAKLKRRLNSSLAAMAQPSAGEGHLEQQ